MDKRFARYDIAGDAVAFFMTDNVNSVRMIVDPTGAVQWTGHYTAFGTLASSSGPGGDRFTFTGRELDATGQYYYRARYYGAGIGRFTSEDPIGFTAGDGLADMAMTLDFFISNAIHRRPATLLRVAVPRCPTTVLAEPRGGAGEFWDEIQNPRA